MEPLGKFFYIQSAADTDAILTVKRHPQGSGIVVATDAPSRAVSGRDEQLWYQDKLTGTLRNKLNNYCLDVEDSSVVINEYDAIRDSQRWMFEGGYLRLACNPAVVLEALLDGHVALNSIQPDSNNKQSWVFIHSFAQYFVIRASNSKMVLDVKKEDSKAGNYVILWPDKGALAPNQLWYEDENGIIRSKLNNFALDASGKYVTMMPYSPSEPLQQWVVGPRGLRCLTAEDSGITPCKYYNMEYLVLSHASPGSAWTFEYIDPIVMQPHDGRGKHFTITSAVHGLVMEVIMDVPTPRTLCAAVGASMGGSMGVSKGVSMGGTMGGSMGGSMGGTMGGTMGGSMGGSMGELRSGNWTDYTSDRRLFYMDKVTGTIRTATNGFCLDIADNRLVVNPYDPDSTSQEWRVWGRLIQNTPNLNVVAGLETSDKSGTKIEIGQYRRRQAQHWNVENVPAKCFFLISKLNGLVIDVYRENKEPGTTVVTWSKKADNSPNQLWYEDEIGIIRSSLNGFVLDATEGSVVMKPYSPTNIYQHWLLVEDRIRNRLDETKTISIAQGAAVKGTALCADTFRGNACQKWIASYV